MWTPEEREIVKENYGKISNKIIQQKLLDLGKRVSLDTLTSYANRSLKLKTNQRLCQRTYQHNENYFSIPNIENSYWAGFIAADGCLIEKKTGQKGLKIIISKKDKELLETFKNHIEFSGDIKKVAQNEFEYASITIWCADNIHKDLNKYWNITSKKTYTLLSPNINEDILNYAFLIGFIDGDGCWRNYKVKTTTKHTFGASGTESMMMWMKEQFNKLVPENKSITINKVGNYFTYQSCGKRALLIREKLKNIINIPWKLKRKWET